MCASVLFLAVAGESHFDETKKNNAPLWLLSIPLTIFLICQALQDLKFLRDNKDRIQIRLFYSLDNPQKKVWVYGNLGATFIFSACLFCWLYILQNNEKNRVGKKEDKKVLNLAFGSSVFYLLFLIDRVGCYILDLFHKPFQFEMMK